MKPFRHRPDIYAVPILFCLAIAYVSAEEQTTDSLKHSDASRLTLERIFTSDDFRGERVPVIKWLEGGGYTTLQSIKGNKDVYDIVKVDASGKKDTLVASGQLVPKDSEKPLSIQGYEISKDLDLVLIYTNSVKVWRQNTRGDYWVFRRSTERLTKLGGDAKPSTLMFAKLSPDGKQVAYVRENNLFVETTDGGNAIMLTKDGSNDIINGTFDWVYEEEFSCRDGFRWSPDGQQIAYWQLDTTDVKKFSLVDFTTENYPVMKSFAYPKTGEQNARCRIGVVPVAGGATKWIEVPGDTQSDYYIPRMEWAGNSRELAIQRANRLQNAVDVMIADSVTGKVRNLLTERDGTWVDIQDDAMEWIDNYGHFTWISEREGWRQLYIVSRDGQQVRRAIHCDFDIIQVLRVDEKSKTVYFLASPDNPTQQYLYSAPLDGTDIPERLTPMTQSGTHEYVVSTDGAFASHTYSAFGKPPRVDIVSLPDHKVIETLSTNKKARMSLEKFNKTPVEFFRVDIGNGVQLDGWLMKPADFDENKKYPLLLHVYGEPASQSVRDRWGGNNYLWHLMLAQQGYVVACVDNRGTPCPRGREWRKAAYRRVGTLASEDQAAATRELLKRPYVDAKRVGVWGWSGGGSMTLNLMFRYPDLYHTGMAVASVPDMRLYDTIYEERYMGLPQDNAEDYRQGSPITHAAGLKGDLLIVHGSGDDNCHLQGMEKLVNRLVELNKPFSQIVYPNRSHSINEGKTTSLHLYGSMTRFLYDNLKSEPTR